MSQELILKLIKESYFMGRAYQLNCGMFGKSHADKKEHLKDWVKAEKHFRSQLKKLSS